MERFLQSLLFDNIFQYDKKNYRERTGDDTCDKCV